MSVVCKKEYWCAFSLLGCDTCHQKYYFCWPSLTAIQMCIPKVQSPLIERHSRDTHNALAMHTVGAGTQDAPFFTVKLQVKVLPCLVFFLNGVAVDRAVGFDEYGARDDFPVSAVEKRMMTSMVIVPPQLGEDDSDPEDLPEHRRRALKQSLISLTGSSDEDSDFD